MPVLILTARDSWHEKVASGADDYLAKPFAEELLAVCRPWSRRPWAGLAAVAASPWTPAAPLSTGITSTSHEYRLLAYLMHRPARWSHVASWSSTPLRKTSTVTPTRSRSSSAASGENQVRPLIETVRGMGYRLVSST